MYLSSGSTVSLLLYLTTLLRVNNMLPKTIIAVLITASMTTIEASAATAHTVSVTGHEPTAQPTLNNITPDVGTAVTVTNGFVDVDGDVEDTTTAGTSYQWQIVTDVGGVKQYTDIKGATGKTYKPVEADRGQKLRAKVIPRTNMKITEPFEGLPATSSIATVKTLVPDPVHSALAVVTSQANNTITADDGTSTDAATKATVTLTLKSVNDILVPNQTVNFTVLPANIGTTVSAVIDNKDGTYTATINGTKAQAYTVTPTVSGTVFGDTTTNMVRPLTVVAAAINGTTSSVDIPKDAESEGSPLTVDVRGKDKFSNVIAPGTYIKQVTLLATDPDGVITTTTTTGTGDNAVVRATVIPVKYNNSIRTNLIKINVGVINLADKRKLAWAPNYYGSDNNPKAFYAGCKTVSVASGIKTVCGQAASKEFGYFYINSKTVLKASDVVGTDTLSSAPVKSGITVAAMPTSTMPSINSYSNNWKQQTGYLDVGSTAIASPTDLVSKKSDAVIALVNGESKFEYTYSVQSRPDGSEGASGKRLYWAFNRSHVAGESLRASYVNRPVVRGDTQGKSSFDDWSEIKDFRTLVNYTTYDLGQIIATVGNEIPKSEQAPARYSKYYVWNNTGSMLTRNTGKGTPTMAGSDSFGRSAGANAKDFANGKVDSYTPDANVSTKDSYVSTLRDGFTQGSTTVSLSGGTQDNLFLSPD